MALGVSGIELSNPIALVTPGWSMNKTLDLTMEVIEHKAIAPPVARRRRVWIGIVAVVAMAGVYFAMLRPCGCALPPMPCCAPLPQPFPEPPAPAVP